MNYSIVNLSDLNSTCFMSLSNLEKILKNRRCKYCDSSEVELTTSSVKGTTHKLKIKCKGCEYNYRMDSAASNFNQAFWLAATSNGFGISQIQNFLYDLNFNGLSDNQNAHAIQLMSVYNTDLRNQVKTEIIELGRKDQARWLKEAIESKDQVIYLCMDGAYPTRYFI